MQWKTALTKITPDGELVRGYKLSDLVQKKGFAATIFLLLKGALPTTNEARMMDVLLTAAIDHGVGTASALGARISASAGNSLHTSVAAGILSFGERHGLAVEGAARFFKEQAENSDLKTLLEQWKAAKKRVPGFGHRLLTVDHRSELLFAVAKETGVFGKHCECALKTEEALNSLSSKKLPLNVDGAMGAVLMDMGFDWQLAQGIFIIARTPGLVAQAYEEKMGDEGLRRLSEEEEEYIGETEKNID